MNEQVDLFKIPSRAPFGFGMHPKLARRLKDDYRSAFKPKKILLSQLFDSRHPEVFVIPRDRNLYVLDDSEEPIGFQRLDFPFSSTDFYVELDEKKGTLFYELSHTDAFYRLHGINQLGYLVPPKPDEFEGMEISYTTPVFSHNRLLHSLLTAIVDELVLARNGFSAKERAPSVLTAGYHDVATPAGGDSIKRVDPEGLDEEENFAWVLQYYGLPKRWEKFGFDLSLAREWVKGGGMFGRLLGVIDQICYVALDCYCVGLERPGVIRDFCLEHPLVMDVWQDIRFTSDKTSFGFLDSERLFNFLLLRVYEFQDFLYNPYSRVLDLFLKKLVQPLYEKGVITKEQLLVNDDAWLEEALKQYYPDEIRGVIDPEQLAWKKFAKSGEWEEFQNVCLKNGTLDHADRLKRFSTGLDLPVFSGNPGKLIPLRETLDKGRVSLLEEIACSREGYYVYYRRP